MGKPLFWRRIRSADPAFLLLPLWLFCLGLHLEAVLSSRLAEPVAFATASVPNEYPRVAGFRSERGPDPSSLELGDRLIRVGSVDMRGKGFIEFDALAIAAHSPSRSVPIEIERNGERRRVELVLVPAYAPWLRVTLVGSNVVCAVIVLARARSRRAARPFFLGILSAAFVMTSFKAGSILQVTVWQWWFWLWGMLTPVLVLRWMIMFPPELAASQRVWPRWPWLIAAAYGVSRGSYLFGGPFPGSLAPAAVLASDSVFFGSMVWVMSRNYRRCGARGRRRMRWMIYGAYVGFLPVALNALYRAFEPTSQLGAAGFVVVTTTGLAFPIATVIAIVRDNLYDIDELISSSAALVTAGFVSISAGLIAVPWVAEAIGEETAWNTLAVRVGVGISAAALATAVIVGAWPAVIRLLMPEREDLVAAVARLEETLGSETGAARMRRGIESLVRLLHPQFCHGYWISGESYRLVSTFGAPAPASIGAADQRIASISGHCRIVLDPYWRARRQEITRIDSAVLSELGAAGLVPVGVAGAMRGLIVLGPKRSADLYTEAERIYMTRLAEGIAATTGDRTARDDLADLSRAADSIVAIVDAGRSGSGFFAGPHGRILTSAHVVEGVGAVRIRLAGGDVVRATVESVSPEVDLALLVVAESDPPMPLDLVAAASLRPGDAVFAIGSPGSSFGKLHGTVSRGIVSAHRELASPIDPRRRVRMVQTDAMLNPGNSGGPLLDASGRVVGIVTLSDGAVRGVAFAVASEEAIRAFPELQPFVGAG